LLNQKIPISDVKGAMNDVRLENVVEQPSAAARRLTLAQILHASVEDSAPVDQAVLAGIQWLSRHPHGRIQQLSQWTGVAARNTNQHREGGELYLCDQSAVSGISFQSIQASRF
jgi:hypothetical protein